MQRTRVSSTTLSSVGYDADTNMLELEFTSREVYDYYNVPGGEYMGLMIAASKGVFFNEHIKGRYAFKKAGKQPD